jgi:amino acid transporter
VGAAAGAAQAERIEDLPPAIMGTVGIASGVYVLMALSLSFMVTPDQLLACGTTEATDAPLAPAGQTYTPIQGDGCPAALDRNYQLAFNYAFTANGAPARGSLSHGQPLHEQVSRSR